MERQTVTTKKDGGIVNDANLWATETMGNARSRWNCSPRHCGQTGNHEDRKRPPSPRRAGGCEAVAAEQIDLEASGSVDHTIARPNASGLRELDL